MIEKQNRTEKSQAEALRFHAFMIIGSFTKEVKTPQDLLKFSWEKKTDEVTDDEWKKRAENFRAQIARKYGK